MSSENQFGAILRLSDGTDTGPWESRKGGNVTWNTRERRGVGQAFPTVSPTNAEVSEIELEREWTGEADAALLARLESKPHRGVAQLFELNDDLTWKTSPYKTYDVLITEPAGPDQDAQGDSDALFTLKVKPSGAPR